MISVNEDINKPSFKLIKDNYDIYDMFGIEISNQKKNYFRGKKPIDLKVNKLMKCYIMNIANDKPFASINISQNKTISGLMILKPNINQLDYLDLYFTNNNNRPFWQEYNDFSLTVTIKGVILENHKDTYINNSIIISEVNENNNQENNQEIQSNISLDDNNQISNSSNNLLEEMNQIINLQNN